jgi:SAM-dependent methyltransferase
MSSSSPYERAVLRLHADPSLRYLVENCYLDHPPISAARRFAESSEFHEVCRLLGLDGAKNPRDILDVGCGSGIASFAFASRGHRVCAMDPDPSPWVGLGALETMLPELKTGSIQVWQSSIEEAEASARFDIVYLRQAVHHFTELESGLARCACFLRPGGVFLATREHVAETPEELEIFRQKHDLAQDGVQESAYSVARYISALKASGLTKIRVFGPYDSPINYFPMTEERVQQKACDVLRRRIGPLSPFALRYSSAVRAWAARRLSEGCKRPGRRYSFLGFKCG